MQARELIAHEGKKEVLHEFARRNDTLFAKFSLATTNPACAEILLRGLKAVM
jgi:methylglyoxal synthase